MFGPRPDVQWSADIDEADWVRARLAPSDDGTIASVIPQGFAAYARVLHPLRPAPEGVVRWAEVAAWSGRELRPDSEFHSIAFPIDNRDDPPPWNAARPLQGTLDLDDAAALIGALRQHTSTPDRCWFCLWTGYGWGGSAVAVLRRAGEPATKRPAPVDPIPSQIRTGQRVEMPGREYFLYVGPITDALAFRNKGQTPNLFWPDDRAWCVASELDTTSTFVGGSQSLIDQVIGSDDIEALPVNPSQPASRIEDWVVALAESATETLLTRGEAIVSTSRGTVKAWIEASGFRGRSRFLARRWTAGNGEIGGEGRTVIGKATDEDQRDLLRAYLATYLVQLVE